MSKYLIVNADGFGFTRGINRGITEAAERGIITSVSVNANFDAIEELPAFVRAFPHISVGVHLNPVVGRPVSPPIEVPTLVTTAGEFHYRDFARRLTRGEIARDELMHELAQQVQRVRDMGIPVSHLDSHQNQHLRPPFFGLFISLLTSLGVPCMRTHDHYVPADSPRIQVDRPLFYLRNPIRLTTHLLTRYEMRQARRRGVLMADRLMSTACSGDKAVLARWLQLLRNVPAGWNEVFCHPAYPDDDLRRWATYVDQRRTEIDVMTCRETWDEVRRCGIELKSFHDMYRARTGKATATPEETTSRNTEDAA